MGRHRRVKRSDLVELVQK
ncbi:hypothetical protein [Alkaliphilus metalliredigens]